MYTSLRSRLRYGKYLTLNVLQSVCPRMPRARLPTSISGRLAGACETMPPPMTFFARSWLTLHRFVRTFVSPLGPLCAKA